MPTPPLYNAPPILIDSIDHTLLPSAQDPFVGPMQFGSALYITMNWHEGGGLLHIHTFKSVDNGATWVRKDAANGPVAGSNSLWSFASGTTIISTFNNSGSQLQTIVFDTATDTYGTAGPTVGANTLPQSVQVSNGDVYTFYMNATTTHINYRKYSGGAWGPDTLFAPIVSGQSYVGSGRYQLIVDSNDLIHVFYPIVVGAVTSVTFYHSTLATSGAITLNQSIDVLGSGATNFFPGVPVIVGSSIYVPMNADFRNAQTVWVGTPATSTTPVWTRTTASGTQPASYFSQVDSSATCATDGTTAFVFWTVWDNNGNIDQIWYASTTGTVWSAPVLFFDVVLNPTPQDPTIPASDQYIFDLSAAVLANGAFGVIANMLYSESLFNNAGYYMQAGGGISSGYTHRMRKAGRST